jgi:glucose-6-phosphate-specific signal transduction histidine kinase
VKLDYDVALEKQLSAEQKLMICRIIQEQTNNIVKYAKAGKIVIGVKKKTKSLHLVI